MTFQIESCSESSAFRSGKFAYYIEGDRWEWSDELARLHGYPSASAVELTTELLLRHKHPDDRVRVAELIDRVRSGRESFSGRHRIVDVSGNVVEVMVVADIMVPSGAAEVVGTAGYYIALDYSRGEAEIAREDQQRTRDRVAEVLEQRMLIEQAKGILRFVYQLDDQQAFDLLVWRSQQTNTKIRDLAALLCDQLGSVPPSNDTRARFDRLLLTVHESAGPALDDEMAENPSAAH
ncbi:hypothetical protein GOEFS_086_00220 [Gordonia effusa NBRC 100432]|uniref:ANTAR domain-containing protein n=1 Tax=Gordonia effusa NBRC 100432 TaxID=1077974 RepID=H0R301_9ACTN|nr:PAS and ANTAR domain-containing protein [Gordonia effusa]GAB19452.1 hypothetical protein GOEFS_086_00220 [Gordonia effusa NBRC 100432]